MLENCSDKMMKQNPCHTTDWKKSNIQQIYIWQFAKVFCQQTFHIDVFYSPKIINYFWKSETLLSSNAYTHEIIYKIIIYIRLKVFLMIKERVDQL